MVTREELDALRIPAPRPSFTGIFVPKKPWPSPQSGPIPSPAVAGNNIGSAAGPIGALLGRLAGNNLFSGLANPEGGGSGQGLEDPNVSLFDRVNKSIGKNMGVGTSNRTTINPYSLTSGGRGATHGRGAPPISDVSAMPAPQGPMPDGIIPGVSSAPTDISSPSLPIPGGGLNLPATPPIEGRQPAGDINELVQELLLANRAIPLKDLAALTDAWTGSQFRAGHINDEDATGRGNKIINAEVLLKHLDLETLKALLSHKGTEQMKLGESLRIHHTLSAEVSRIAGKITDDYSKLTNGFSNAIDSVSTGNSQDITSVLGRLARGISGEVGAMNEGDINRILMPTLGGEFAKITGFLFNNPQAQVPQQVRKTLLDMLSRASKNENTNAQDKLTAFLGDLQERPELQIMGINPEERLKSYFDIVNKKAGRNTINLEKAYANKSVGTIKKSTLPQGKAVKDMTPQEVRDYLKSKGE